MRIITISREFGSGGRELGKRLSDALGVAYYDREIIAAVTKNSGLDIRYVENLLNEKGVQTIPMTYRATLGSVGYLQSCKVDLLLRQREVIEEIAALGRDCVIVGRNADVILRRYQPLNLFVCAEAEAKLRRCMERAPEGEDLTEREMLRQIRQIDRMRAQTRAILSGSEWGQRYAYHLTVNTSDWKIKDMAPAIAEFANRWFGRT